MIFKDNFRNQFPISKAFQRVYSLLTDRQVVFSLFKKGLKKLQTSLAESEIVEYIESDIRDTLLKLNARFHQAFPQLSLLNFFFKNKTSKYRFAAVLDFVLIAFIAINAIGPVQRIVAPLVSPLKPLQPLTKNEAKNTKEVFGFAPQWTFNKLDNVDFNVLTTMAYFGLDVDGEGNLDRESAFYRTFKSDEATRIFKKAHASGTRVVLTITQMDNAEIRALMDNPKAQEKAINEVTAEVKNRGIDGVNVDFEYSGNPGQAYRDKYTKFIADLTTKMHAEIPDSKVSIAVYASAIKEPKIYDIEDLGKLDIQVFMMAYDFGYSGSDQVIPTSPLYGYKSGKYWYDVSTAVDDFLKEMPAEKLILGSAWYGYNYSIAGQPQPKANVITRGRAQTYAIAQEDVTPNMEGISDYKEGWDDEGKVGWKAYYSNAAGAWRMLFVDDPRSLSYKYDFAKDKNLAGVGIWALGFDNGRTDLWAVLQDKFGNKDLANNTVMAKEIK